MRDSMRDFMRGIFSRCFSKDYRILAAFTGTGFKSGDHADIAIIIKIVEFIIFPGLKFDDLYEIRAGKSADGDLKIALSIAFIQPNGCGGIDWKKWVVFAVGGFN